MSGWKDDDRFDDVAEESMSNIITLNTADGETVDFEFLDLIEYDGEEYVVLLPVVDEEEDGSELVILKVEANEENPELENYASVEDDDALQAVFRIFKEKFKDLFNYLDEE